MDRHKLSISTVARILRIKNIPSIVFEAKSKGKAYANHGLWLGPAVCQSLVAQLKISLEDFRKRVAVTAELPEATSKSNSEGVRANKRRLLEFLEDGVDVRWEHKLKSSTSRENEVEAQFENGESVKGSFLVAADGVHSTCAYVAVGT
jgi:flavin-dependent dehydrogenase